MRRKAEGRKKEETRNRRIWSAKCEEFSRVAFTVTSIDTADIYLQQRGMQVGVAEGRGCEPGMDPVYFRRPEDRESVVPRQLPRR